MGGFVGAEVVGPTTIFAATFTWETLLEISLYMFPQTNEQNLPGDREGLLVVGAEVVGLNVGDLVGFSYV